MFSLISCHFHFPFFLSRFPDTRGYFPAQLICDGGNQARLCIFLHSGPRSGVTRSVSIQSNPRSFQSRNFPCHSLVRGISCSPHTEARGGGRQKVPLMEFPLAHQRLPHFQYSSNTLPLPNRTLNQNLFVKNIQQVLIFLPLQILFKVYNIDSIT